MAAPNTGQSTAPNTAERRQLTVVFCDLVGSTALSARLDPEEMRHVMHLYQETCGRVVLSFGGSIAQTLGDGLLIYFGYPEAHEDDAERAVRASLAIVRAVTDDDGPLCRAAHACRVRIGIHTGLVVAGNVGQWDTRANMAVFGETPNIAARLQHLAGENQVVISPQTLQLVEGSFVIEALGPQELRGVPEPLQVSAVLREMSEDERLRARHGIRAMPIVGREAELSFLQTAWAEARGGQGQCVILAAPAGMGKSRLSAALCAQTAEERPLLLQYRGLPYFSNTLLYPVASQLQRAARIRPQDSTAQKQRKLLELIGASAPDPATNTALLSQLLQIPVANPAELADKSPERVLEDTLSLLLEWLTAWSRSRPVLLIIEDAHWLDPTTRQLVRQVLGRLTALRLLMLVTTRSTDNAWLRAGPVRTLTLGRLANDDCRRIISAASAGRELARRVVSEILSRADGVPLFVEELTKGALESGADHAHLTVPASLQDSLTARLDRMGPLKRISQLAACIGKTFSFDLLMQVTQLDASRLSAGLERLERAELLSRDGPAANFEFRHALLQQAAYDSLLKSERRQVHAEIARALRALHPDTCRAEPEVVAHHLAAAGEQESAAQYYLEAGLQAQRRSAHGEAVAHLEAGLQAFLQARLQARLQAGLHGGAAPEREIDLQAALARSHMAREGWGSTRLNAAYARARLLCRGAGNARKECEMLWGLWVSHANQGDYSAALGLADEYVELAESERDRSALLMADSTALITHFLLGDFQRAQFHAERVQAGYQVDQDQRLVHVFNHDPLALALNYQAMWQWVQGSSSASQSTCLRAVEQARCAHHAFQSCFTLFSASSTSLWLRDDARALALADEALHLAREHRFRLFEAYGPLNAAPALVARRPSFETLRWLQACMTAVRVSRARMYVPVYLLRLAEAHEVMNEVSEASSLVAEALEMARETGECWAEPELQRARARLISKRGGGVGGVGGAGGIDVAELALRQGLECALQLNARGSEQRVSCDLAELLLAQGRDGEAASLLGPLCDAAEEAGDAADLRRARALLRRLS